MGKHKGIGSVCGSLLAYQMMSRAAENKSTKVVKSEAQLRNEEFLAIKAEHEKEFITVEVPNSDYEKAISGQATKLVEMSRDSYEKRYGISDLRKTWNQSIADIQVQANLPLERLKMVDSAARWLRLATPIEMTEENAAKAMQNAAAFLDSKGLQGEDRDKVLLFTAYCCDSDSTIDILNPEIWSIAYQRLQQLGVLSVSEQPTPEAQDLEAPTSEPSLTEFRDAAEERWYSLWEDTWNSWCDSMAQTWGFYPNEAQAHKAIDLLMKLESYGDDKFNEARRRLTKSGVFKSGMLTEDELLAERFETGMSQAEFARERNRIKYGN
jgi:hypothetical protein